MEDFDQGLGQGESGIMRPDFGEVRNVANVVTLAGFVDIGCHLGQTGNGLGLRKSLQKGATVLPSAAKIVNLRDSWRLEKMVDELRNVVRMDIIAHLFPFVAVNIIIALFEVAFDQITQETVQLNSAMSRAGQAATAQTTGGHSKIAAVLLNQNVGGEFAGPKERMFRLINRHRFRNASREVIVVIVPPSRQFLQTDAIGCITIDLVG
jgi:hypothetical protein